MQSDDRNDRSPKKSPDDRIIISSPLRLGIFAVAILAVAAVALTLISPATPLTIEREFATALSGSHPTSGASTSTRQDRLYARLN